MSFRCHALARVVTGIWLTLAGAVIADVPTALSAQRPGSVRGGGGSSTARVVSPAVYASWMSNENYANGSKSTLLVLWRGTPGWHMKRADAAGGRSSSSGGNGGHGYQTFTQGGLTFTLEFDFENHIVKLVNQEISLRDANVVLVDSVDSVSGPTIAGTRWIEPTAGLASPGGDPIAAIVKSAPALFEYLRCDVTVGDAVPDAPSDARARAAMSAMMQFVCHQMRP